MQLTRFLQRDLDPVLLSSVLLATVTGITMIYSATFDWDLGSGGAVYKKQIVWAAISFVAMAITMAIPMKFFYAFAYILYGIAVILLVLVLELGDRRWFDLGPVFVQPSELAKLTTVLALARYLSMRNLNLERVRTFVVPLMLVVVPALLVYKQPDLGTAMVFLAVLLPMLFWAGLRPSTLFFILAPALSLLCAFHTISLAIMILVLVAALFFARPRLTTTVAIVLLNLTIAVGAPQIWNHQLRDYQRRRILTFLNPDLEPRGAGYQVIQSKVAIGSGGLKGKGYLQGTQTKLAFLPAQHTDFIFSVVGEEFGFGGAIAVLMLFLLIIWRAVRISTVAKSRFSSMVAIGVASILVFHVFVNVGMTIGVMPVTGLPLSFLSYGGSWLVMNMVLVGFLLNIYARRHEYY